MINPHEMRINDQAHIASTGVQLF